MKQADLREASGAAPFAPANEVRQMKMHMHKAAKQAKVRCYQYQARDVVDCQPAARAQTRAFLAGPSDNAWNVNKPRITPQEVMWFEGLT